MKNIWILSEERPKTKVVEQIVRKFALDHSLKLKSGDVKIFPVIHNGKFDFKYIIKGINCKGVEDIFIKLVSGSSSFVDFLLFYQKEEPDKGSAPLYAIEETKTDDSESRNTGVYQRCSKFVFISFYYPRIKKIMLYNLQIPQKEKATETNIFGTRMLSTINVEILGKKLDRKIMKPFSNIDGLIKVKNSMRTPPKGNVPIKIKKQGDKLIVSGKLYKADSLSHDPSIGALTMIAFCARRLGWKRRIIVVSHGLKQGHVGKRNKFVLIANKLGIELSGLRVPRVAAIQSYWHYENKSEKVASIFIHLIVESFTGARIIYENHAGCERGYFIAKDFSPLTVEKYKEGERSKYKAGDKTAIIHIPDLIIYDKKRGAVINIEGKTYKTRKQGIKELKNYKYIEKKYIKSLYKPSKIVRTVVVFGSKEKKIKEKEIGFMLNEKGEMILGKNPPAIIKEAIEKLLALQKK